MLATKEELESAKVPLEERGYCAHLALKLRACRRDKWPFPVFCTHEQHAFLNCKYDEYAMF